MEKAWAWLGRFIYYTAGTFVLPFTLHKSQRVKVALIDKQNEQILLGTTWIGKQRWSLIGGGRMQGEDKFVAAIREVKEETGLNIDTMDLEYVDTITESEYMSKYTTDIFITLLDKQPTQRRKLEMLDLKWHSLNKLPKYRNSHAINAALSKYEKQG